MVQVLDRAPSSADRMLGSLERSLPAISDLIMQHRKQQGANQFLSKFQGLGTENSPNLSMNKPTWQDLVALQQSGNNDLANILAPTVAAQEKQDIDLGVKRQRSEQLLGTADEMEDLLPYTGAVQIPFTKSFFGQEGGWNREAVEKRAYFDTLAADAAGFFRDLDTRGQLPQGLYEKVIEPRLPNSKLSERENKGRIKALRSLAKRYGGIGQIPDSLSQSSNNKPIVMRDAEGNIYDIPPNLVEKAKAKGLRLHES